MTEDWSWWVGLGWFVGIGLFSAVVAEVSLTAEPIGFAESYKVSDAVRLDWLIIATLFCFPLQRCARASLLCGFAAVVICTAQSFYVVSTVLERLDRLEIGAAAPWLWYLIPSAHLVCYVGFGISGARRRVADLRWKRLFTALMRDVEVTTRRRWRQAH